MADFWIKIEKSTPDKGELFEMAEILCIDPDEVMGKLVRFWCWADSHSENGHIKCVTNVLIDRVTNCAGFSDALKSVGWLSDSAIPNFDRHLGKSAKKRAKDAERKRMSRTSSGQCHTKVVTDSGTKIGLDKSRVDKRRDSNKTNTPAAPALDFETLGMSPNQIDELKRIRKKNKGGAITQRVINALAKEFHSATAKGYSLDDLLTEWELRGWKAFKSDWIKDKGHSGNIFDQSSTTAHNINVLQNTRLD